jgi:GrpB-like predicted nucleotidyltransferase (UPF0157 family)
MPAAQILLLDYDPAWTQLFADERARILEAAGEWIIAVEHIGSTSIPGIAAKPIIDIAAGLSDLAESYKTITPLTEIGYRCLGEYGIPERIYFRKPADSVGPGQGGRGPERTHQIHMFATSHAEWVRHLAFRDYLRSHPDAVRDYEALKKRLAVEHAADIEAYAEAKSEFVEGIIRLAGAPPRAR